MNHTFRVQLGKELLELWRTRWLIIVSVVLIGFGFLSPIFAKLLPDTVKSIGEGQPNVTIIIPDPTVKDAVDQFVRNTSQFGLLLAVLMSFGAVVGERTGGQAALMLPHPLPRPVFVLAKFAALAVMFGLGIVLGAAADYLYTAILFEAPDPGGFLALVGLVYLWVLSLIALGLLSSTLGRTTTSAGGIAFGLLVIFLLAGSLTSLAPSALLDWGKALATGVDGLDRWGALAVTLILTILSVGGSCVVLQHQEIS